MQKKYKKIKKNYKKINKNYKEISNNKKKETIDQIFWVNFSQKNTKIL